jgi:hypothetical protein
MRMGKLSTLTPAAFSCWQQLPSGSLHLLKGPRSSERHVWEMRSDSAAPTFRRPACCRTANGFVLRICWHCRSRSTPPIALHRRFGYLGGVGVNVLVRLSAFIFVCIGVQIAWGGLSELVGTVKGAPQEAARLAWGI